MVPFVRVRLVVYVWSRIGVDNLTKRLAHGHEGWQGLSVAVCTVPIVWFRSSGSEYSGLNIRFRLFGPEYRSKKTCGGIDEQ